MAEQSRVFPLLAASALTPLQSRSQPPERLIVPSIGLDARIVPIGIRPDARGSPVWETASHAVGHHRGTANPAELGNVVLSWHINSPSEGAVFKRLPQVKLGDGVVVASEYYLYRVTNITTATPAAIDVIQPTGAPVVTLITCVPDRVYSHRLVVRAERL